MPAVRTGGVRRTRTVRAAPPPTASVLAARNSGRSTISSLLRREGIEAYRRTVGALSSDQSPARIRRTASYLQTSTPPVTRSISVLRSTLGQTNTSSLTRLAGMGKFGGGPSVNFQGLLQEGIRQYQLYGGGGQGLTGSLLSATAGLYNKVGPLTANASTLFMQI